MRTRHFTQASTPAPGLTAVFGLALALFTAPLTVSAARAEDVPGMHPGVLAQRTSTRSASAGAAAMQTSSPSAIAQRTATRHGGGVMQSQPRAQGVIAKRVHTQGGRF